MGIIGNIIARNESRQSKSELQEHAQRESIRNEEHGSMKSASTVPRQPAILSTAVNGPQRIAVPPFSFMGIAVSLLNIPARQTGFFGLFAIILFAPTLLVLGLYVGYHFCKRAPLTSDTE